MVEMIIVNGSSISNGHWSWEMVDRNNDGSYSLTNGSLIMVVQ